MRYYSVEEWHKLHGLEYKPMTDREFIDECWQRYPMAWTPLGPLNAKTKDEFERWWMENRRDKDSE